MFSCCHFVMLYGLGFDRLCWILNSSYFGGDYRYANFETLFTG
jgi:hypothetical protein